MVALLATAVLSLFPPWIVVRSIPTRDGQEWVTRTTTAWAPLWSPPEIRQAQFEWPAVDWARLTLAWVACGALAGAILLLAATRKRE